MPLSTACSLGSGLVSYHASRWLGSSPEPFLVPLPRAVAPSRDTGARLSLSGCFPACQASRVGSCRDFPDGFLAPASSPSGWASSWSTKLGRCIALAPALPPQLHAPAPASRPGAGRLPVVPRPLYLGDAEQVVKEWGCERWQQAGTESHRGGRHREKPAASLPGGWGGQTGWASQARAGSVGAFCSPPWLEDVPGESALVGTVISRYQSPGRGAHQGQTGGQGLPRAGNWAGRARLGWLR